MTEEEFVEIMNDNDIKTDWKGNNACRGLDIIRKYCPDGGIEYAEHDIIGSVSVSDIVRVGITKEDAVKLRGLNWMIDENEEGLACFV